MAKNKPRWKDLPFYERFAKQLKQHGVSDEMCEHIREKKVRYDYERIFRTGKEFLK